MIKSGLAKNIIFGLIFSIIFGFMGNYLYKKLKLKDNIVSLNKYYVIEIAKNKNLNKFRNIGIFNHNNRGVHHRANGNCNPAKRHYVCGNTLPCHN